MSGKRQSIAKDLIAQLSQNLQAVEPEAATPIVQPPAAMTEAAEIKEAEPEKLPEPPRENFAASETPSTAGMPYAFQMDEEDERILQEVSMQLYSQGIKPTNNLIFRAALRLLQNDEAFLAKARELKRADGRRRQK